MASPQGSHLDNMAGQIRGSPMRAWYSRPNTSESSRPSTAPNADRPHGQPPFRPQHLDAHLHDIASGDESSSSALDAETRYLPLHSELSISPMRPLNFDFAKRPQTAPPASEQSTSEEGHNVVFASVAEGHTSRVEQFENRRGAAAAGSHGNSRLAANFGLRPQPQQQLPSASTSNMSSPVKPTPSESQPQAHTHKRSTSPMARAVDLEDGRIDQLSSVDLEKLKTAIIAERNRRVSPRSGSLDNSMSVTSSNPSYRSAYSPDKYKTPTRLSLRKSAIASEISSNVVQPSSTAAVQPPYRDVEKGQLDEGPDVKERTLAVTKLQALWRGYRARQYDPDILHVKHELRLRRSEDHIRHLTAELESEKQTRSFLVKVIRILCRESTAAGIQELTVDGEPSITTDTQQQLRDMLEKASAIDGSSPLCQPNKSAASPQTTRRIVQNETSSSEVTVSRASSHAQTSMSTTEFSAYRNLEKEVTELKSVLSDLLQGGLSLSGKQAVGDVDHIHMEMEEDDNGAQIENKSSPGQTQYSVVNLASSLREPIKPGVPTVPGRLCVSNCTSCSLLLQWEPSVVLNAYGKPANKPIIGYRLYINNQPRRMVTTNKVEIDGLHPGSSYELHVRAVAELGESRDSDKVVITMGEETSRTRLSSHDPRPDDSDKDHDSTDDQPPPDSTTGSSNSGTSTSGSLPGSGDSPECGQGTSKRASQRGSGSGKHSTLSISPSAGSTPSPKQTSPHTSGAKSPQQLSKSPAQMRLDFSVDDSGFCPTPLTKERIRGLSSPTGETESPARRTSVRERLDLQRKKDGASAEVDPLSQPDVDTEKIYSPRLTEGLVKRMDVGKEKKLASKMLRAGGRKISPDPQKPMPMRAFYVGGSKDKDTSSTGPASTETHIKEEPAIESRDRSPSFSKIPVFNKSGKSDGSHPNSRRSSFDSCDESHNPDCLSRAGSADSIGGSMRGRGNFGSQEGLVVEDSQIGMEATDSAKDGQTKQTSRGNSCRSSGSSPEREGKAMRRFSSGDSGQGGDVLKNRKKKKVPTATLR